jgi:hypothetical protein
MELLNGSIGSSKHLSPEMPLNLIRSVVLNISI